MNAFRPVSVPLFTNDPYFSIWSFSDHLAEDTTRLWTGRRKDMFGMLRIDGRWYRFMGKMNPDGRVYKKEPPMMAQKTCSVTPLSTVYVMEEAGVRLTLTFTSPLLLDRLAICSRPASYLAYRIDAVDGAEHETEIYLDVSAEVATDKPDARVVFKKTPLSLAVGNVEQKVLHCSGDDIAIDWGYFHLAKPDAYVSVISNRERMVMGRAVVLPGAVAAEGFLAEGADGAVIAWRSKAKADVLVYAYDDGKAIEVFGKQVDAYYKKKYRSFAKMLAAAVADYDKVKKLCDDFDRKFLYRMRKVGRNYAEVGALAYRQAIAAHKLVEVDGKVYFLSKECFSNGCIATLDVTYPSIPLFLLYNPELVYGMLRPLFRYARMEAWPYEFAPHDCGQYPLCNGQVYGIKPDGTQPLEVQMPVEECGNAILSVAAAIRYGADPAFAQENKDLLEKWAAYLEEYGYDPGNQLCTDDFAGHLAHNCNLSLKCIVALGAYGQLYGDVHYAQVAKDMAAKWVQDAKRPEGGYRLTFDDPGGWSLKYNMVWDRLLGLGLFDDSVAREEIAVYKEKCNRYGVPLDCRSDYTKLDWLQWTTMLAEDQEYTEKVGECIRRMVCESRHRVPVTDWYFTSTADQRGFQHRSVLGGYYINLLEIDPEK